MEIGLAEALYDNEAEWPDELAFHQGEILRVLDQKPANGMADGWWLCSDQSGNQGIAPANRLRLIHKFQRGPENRVITPRRFGDVFLYDRLFPEEELFGSKFPVTSGYDFPIRLGRIRLLHDSSHPVRVGGERESGSGRRPVVHEVPIRIEAREGKYRDGRKRRSPPPPPQRRYFHNFSDGSSSEQDQPQKHTTSNGIYGNPDTTQSDPTTVLEGSGSQRSSSLSESSRSSFQDASYDVPSPAVRQVEPATSNSSGSHFQSSGQPARSLIVSVLEDCVYDSPQQLTRGTTSTFNGSCKESISKLSAGSEPIREATYDIPKASVAKAVGNIEQLPSDLERLSVSSIDSTQDYQELLVGGQELNLDPKGGVIKLLELQQELQSAVSNLCDLSSDKNWRRRHVFPDSLSEIRQSVNEVCTCLETFLNFSKGALVNVKAKKAASGSEEDRRRVIKKLAHLLRPLCDSEKILEGLRQSLGDMGWTPANCAQNDPLDQFIAVGKQVPEDCRQVAAFIQGNSHNVFQQEGEADISSDRNSTPHPVPVAETSPGNRIVEEEDLDSWGSELEENVNIFDDYDFVDSRKGEEDGDSATPTGQRLINGNRDGDQSCLNAEDKQIVDFYVSQVNGHMEYLSGAIEGFLTAIEENQPPRIFVGKSKLVVLAAHKLVYIGDSISQCLQSAGPAKQMKSASDKLCQVLKESVSATKRAALHFPAVSYIQSMVDSMVSVSHVAHDLKLLLSQLAA